MKLSRSLSRTLEKHLPRSTWDRLRQIRRRTPYLSAPVVMRRLINLHDQGFSPETILDVGAAGGDWTVGCLSVFPSARYILLEPNPAYAEKLQALASEQITFLKSAAGKQRGDLPLLLPEDPGGASFLPDTSEGFFKGAVEVPVLALDDLQLPTKPGLLKIDVQGYELEVLAGASRIMTEVEVIVLECSLHRFQEGIPLIDEVVAFLTERGFRLFDFGDEVRWGSGTLAQIDLIFVTEGSPLLSPTHWQ